MQADGTAEGTGARPTVILRACPVNVGRVRTIVREGLEELGLRPTGRTLVKPNLVAAARCSRTRTRGPSSSRACCARCGTATTAG